jgi:hypothetical protein
MKSPRRSLPAGSTYTRTSTFGEYLHSHFHLTGSIHTASLPAVSSSAQPLQSHPTCGHVFTLAACTCGEYLHSPSTLAAPTLPPCTHSQSYPSHEHILGTAFSRAHPGHSFLTVASYLRFLTFRACTYTRSYTLALLTWATSTFTLVGTPRHDEPNAVKTLGLSLWVTAVKTMGLSLWVTCGIHPL